VDGMTKHRQDAWNQEEDQLLADVVLRNIKSGYTQLKAFEEVGAQLNRTAAACGFRWNSYLRKQYKAAIDEAKKQRRFTKTNQRTEVENIPTPIAVSEDVPIPQSPEPSNLNFEDVVTYLKNKEGDYLELEKENQQLQEEVDSLQNRLVVIERDYQMLVDIMERARKLINN
jgi:prespore-specific regulator